MVAGATAASVEKVSSGALTKKVKQTLIGVSNNDAQSLSLPMRFHQKLLVCNACTGWEGVKIMKNDVPTKNKEALGFNECRYIDGKIYSQDRINFLFDKESVKGTFEIDELPQADSVLLLIVQRRPEKSADLVSFQSFAFAPSDSLGDNAKVDAQVAFLNTVGGDADTRIRMSDAPAGDRKKTTREEQVMFNHVYAIEEGDYSMSLLSDSASAKDKALAAKIRLQRGEDYVVLKTGTPENPQLIVFPNTPDNSFRLLSMLYVIAVMGPVIALGILLSLLREQQTKAKAALLGASEQESADVIATPAAQDEV